MSKLREAECAMFEARELLAAQYQYIIELRGYLRRVCLKNGDIELFVGEGEVELPTALDFTRQCFAANGNDVTFSTSSDTVTAILRETSDFGRFARLDARFKALMLESGDGVVK